MTDLNAILQERGKRYGDYMELSRVAQTIRDLYRSCEGWAALAADMRETLDMDAMKTARILCGDPNHADTWRDKARAA